MPSLVVPVLSEGSQKRSGSAGGGGGQERERTGKSGGRGNCSQGVWYKRIRKEGEKAH